MSLFLWLNTGYFLIVAIISEIPAMMHIMEAIDGGISSPTLYNSSLYRMFGDNICNKHSIQVILINTNKNIFKLLAEIDNYIFKSNLYILALLRRVTDFIYVIFHVIESVLPSMSVMQQRIAGHLVKLSILLISYNKNRSLFSPVSTRLWFERD